MTKYTVSVKASYYDDLEIEADDVDDARRKAMKEFVPTPDNMFTIDIYGLDPWTLSNLEGDPHAEDPYDQV